jgi:DNA ligase-1
MFQLAREFEGWSTSLEYIQPKLNGIRAMWAPVLKRLVSKDVLQFCPNLTGHILEELKGCPYLIDGELYVHGLPLQDINSAIAVKKRGTEPALHIQFHAFDVSLNRKFKDRLPILGSLAGKEYVKVVETKRVRCHANCEAYYHAFVAMGYEGAVYKSNAVYRSGRSQEWRKRKEWRHDEYDIKSFSEGQGKFKGMLGSLELVTAEGRTFMCDLGEGFTTEARKSLWVDRNWSRARVKSLIWSNENIPLNAKVTNLYRSNER